MKSLFSVAPPLRAVKWAAKLTSLACRAVLALMVLHIVADVALRYLFDIALPGTIAFVSNYYMVAIIFLPLATAEIESKHIEVEVLSQALPPAAQACLRMAGWLIAGVIFTLMMVETWAEAGRAYTTGKFIIEHGFRIPIWMSYYMLPIGFAAIAAACWCRIIVACVSLGVGAAAAVSRAEKVFDEEPRDA